MSITKFKKLTQDWIVYYKTHWHFVDHASGSSLVKEDEYHHDSASSWYSHQVQVAEFWMLMYYIVHRYCPQPNVLGRCQLSRLDNLHEDSISVVISHEAHRVELVPGALLRRYRLSPQGYAY